jgi:hypothetical protein
MRRSLLAITLLVAGCSPAESGDTTTSAPDADTTTVPPQVTTTVAPTSTTSTVATTTTSTTVPSTTSTTLLEGTWADGPVVTTGFGALGWWDGSAWLEAAVEEELPVVGGEDYQTVRLNEIGRTTGGPQTTVCEPLDLIGVELEDPGLLGDLPGAYGVAISAPWPLQPHLFEAVADDGQYAGFARQLLSERGLDVPNPVIKQLFRTDLEGDGVNEVLVAAEEVSPGFIMEPGDYSVTFMRKVVDGDVQTAVLAATVALDEDDQFDGAHGIGGVADLNGDGQMEIISNSAYFEGFGVTVWEYVDDDLGPFPVLETGCGS